MNALEVPLSHHFKALILSLQNNIVQSVLMLLFHDLDSIFKHLLDLNLPYVWCKYFILDAVKVPSTFHCHEIEPNAVQRFHQFLCLD